MKAAVLQDHSTIRLQDVNTPEPSADEALVKVNMGGICGSDHSTYRGKIAVAFPLIPGHEAVGTISRLGQSVEGLEIGQRVTIQPNFSCNTCALCQSGHGNICASKIRLGVDIDGVFAEYVKVPARYVWTVPDSLSDQIAVFTEPLAVCIHAMRRIRPKPGDRVLIFGAGVIGLMTAQLAVREGAQVTAADLSEKRLSLARQLGASQTIGPDTERESYFNQFDVIYETSGAPMAFDQTVRLAAGAGKICLLGLPGSENPISVDMIVRKELRVAGAMIYTDEFSEALDLLQSGHIQTSALTTSILPLAELESALKAFGDPMRIKTLVSI